MEDNRTKLQAWDYKPYGYLNTVESEVYVDLPMESPFPSLYDSELKKYAINDSFLPAGLPAVYTYFSVTKSGSAPVGIFAKSARKNKAISVCRYTQAAGWPWSEGELYRDAFDSLLNFGFYSEEETDALARHQAAPAFGRGTGSNGTGMDVAIHPSALKALVYAGFLRWHRSAPLVRVAVPAQFKGEAYNAYVLSAVRSLYSYFPVGLRVKAGFSSYLPVGREKSLPGLYFGFVPQEEADSSTLFLDGSSLAVYEKLPKTMNLKSLDHFIEYLLNLTDPQARQDFISKVFTDVDGRGKILGLAPAKYVFISDTLQLLNHESSTLEMMPEWIRFCNAPDHYPSSLVPELYAAIKRELTPNVFADYLEKEYPDDIPFEELGEKYKAILNLCCTANAFREGFWNRLDALLENSGAPSGKVLSFLRQQEKGLKRIGLVRWQNCYEFWRQKYASDVKKMLFAKMDAQSCGYQQLPQENAKILASAQELLLKVLSEEETDAILSEVRLHGANLVAAQLKAALLTLSCRPTENSQEIQAVIAEAKNLQQIAAGENGDNARDVSLAIGEFITEKGKLLGERDVVRNKVMADLYQIHDYFTALESISEALKANTSLEEADKTAFLSAVTPLRPRQEKDYREAFRSRYGKVLTMDNLNKQDPLVVTCVLKDLNLFFSAPCRFGKKNLTARELRDKILHRQAQVQQFQENPRLTVEVEGVQGSADLFKALLSCGNLTNFPSETVAEAANALVSAGVYTGEDMAPVFDMYIQNGLKFKNLILNIFGGSFQNATEEDYLRVYKKIAQALRQSGRKSPAEEMAKLMGHSADPTARAAFQKYLKSQPKKGGKGAVVTAVIMSCLCLLLLAGCVLLGFGYLNQSNSIAQLNGELDDSLSLVERLTGNESTIRDLEAKLNAPADPAFTENRFKDYFENLRRVSALDAVDPEYELYNTRYCLLNRDYVVTTVNGQSITWGEYFFWECYFLGKLPEAATAADFESETLNAQVMEALAITHSQVGSGITGSGAAATLAKAPAEGQALSADADLLVSRVWTHYRDNFDLECDVESLFETTPPSTEESSLLDTIIPVTTMPGDTASEDTAPAEGPVG